jgi:hypothetical protein
MATISPVYGTGQFERDPRAGKTPAKPKGAPPPLPFLMLLNGMVRGADWYVTDPRFESMIRRAVYALNVHATKALGIKGREVVPAFVTTYRVNGDVKCLCVTRCI